MWLLIVVGCCLVVANFVIRGLFYQPVLDKWGKHDCRINLEQIAAKLALPNALQASMRQRRDAAALAHFFVLAGLQQLAVSHPQPVALRLRVEKWQEIVLPLSLLAAVFVFLLGKQPMLSLLALVMINALLVILKWVTRSIASHAAERGYALLQQARIPSEDDEAIVLRCIRAHLWK